jgi:hypothetical protein
MTRALTAVSVMAACVDSNPTPQPGTPVAYRPHSEHQRRVVLRGAILLLAAATPLAACDTPVGVPPSWRNLPMPPTQVTNPDGGGPQVTRWGPPGTSNIGRGP